MAILAASFSANAAISDLNHQLDKGTGSFGLNLSREVEYLEKEPEGGNYSEATNTTLSFTTKAGYGITEKLSFDIKLTTLFDKNYEYYEIGNTGGAENHTESIKHVSGIKDPKINFSYRLLENAPATVDINAGGTVSVGNSKAGSNLRGGHVLKLGADASKKLGKIELLSTFNFYYNMNTESEASDGTVTENENSTKDMELKVAAQLQASEKLFFNLKASIYNAGVPSEGTGDIINTTSFGLGMKYQPAPNAMFYVNVERSNSDLYDGEAYSSMGVEEYSFTTLDLGVNFLF